MKNWHAALIVALILWIAPNRKWRFWLIAAWIVATFFFIPAGGSTLR
jgi:hypothetical protein